MVGEPRRRTSVRGPSSAAREDEGWLWSSGRCRAASAISGSRAGVPRTPPWTRSTRTRLHATDGSRSATTAASPRRPRSTGSCRRLTRVAIRNSGVPRPAGSVRPRAGCADDAQPRLPRFGEHGPASAVQATTGTRRAGLARRWVDLRHLLDLLAASSLLPGPNSTPMTMHNGDVQRGNIGMWAASGGLPAPRRRAEPTVVRGQRADRSHPRPLCRGQDRDGRQSGGTVGGLRRGRLTLPTRRGDGAGQPTRATVTGRRRPAGARNGTRMHVRSMYKLGAARCTCPGSAPMRAPVSEPGAGEASTSPAPAPARGGLSTRAHRAQPHDPRTRPDHHRVLRHRAAASRPRRRAEHRPGGSRRHKTSVDDVLGLLLLQPRCHSCAARIRPVDTPPAT